MRVPEEKYELAAHFLRLPRRTLAHLRTANPIESVFATIRHRARQTKGCGSRFATPAMMFKLGCECEKDWRRPDGCEQIHQLIEGIRFIDGPAEQAACTRFPSFLLRPAVHNF